MKNTHTTFAKKIERSEQNVRAQGLEPAFRATRSMFRDYLNYERPLSYEEWLAVADDQKAAVLYVQFFDQISLAWYKAKSFYAVEEDGVSTVIQYLMKNVPLIAEKKSKFSAPYIYRVAYNCLYCICHDIKRDKLRFELETSNIQTYGDDEFDLFDSVSDPDSILENVLDREHHRERFWGLIEDLDQDSIAVVEQLLNGTSLPADVRKRKDEILEELRTVLADYKAIYYI